jgi:hypothetical protein
VETPDLTPDTAVYLYGFLSPRVDLPRLISVEDISDVFLVAAGDTACAVSLVPAAEYARARSGAEQAEWVAPRALRHHQILRALHASSPVVPLKFGTLCDSVAGVQAVLHRLRPAVALLLSRFEGADEWALKVSADPRTLSAALLVADPVLIACAEEAHRLPGGAAYFARKKLQMATTHAVAQTLDAVTRLLYERLAVFGVEWVELERHGSELPGRATIAQTALLVARDRFAELEALFADLEVEHAASGIGFELVGPWPPYSFSATLNAADAPAR